MIVDESFARASYAIASTLVLISIIISGILIGLGKAFSSKRLSAFGFEELFQSIINGALVGGAFTITTIIDSLGKESVPPGLLFDGCLGDASILATSLCSLNKVYSQLSALMQSSAVTTNIIGFVSKLSFTFGSVSAQPFFSLESSATNLWLIQFYLLIIMVATNIQYLIVDFLSKYALSLLFPIGIFFRSFFATRKIGGAFIGLAIGAYIFFPLSIYLSLSLESDGWIAYEGLSSTLSDFHADFGAIASVDLSDGANIRHQIDRLRSEKFVDRVAEIFAKYSALLSLLTMQNIIMPFFGFLISAFAVIQLSRAFGGEIFGVNFWMV
ncbi:MAG: hypothetical protein QXW70_00290 [Candidatus Anstonellales archaeon]